MHPMLLMLAFGLAALLTYVLVLGLLTALSIRSHEDDPQPADDPAWRERAAR
jgi:hypothetical protein